MFLKDSLIVSIWKYINIFEKYIGKKIYLIFFFSFIGATAESLGLLFLLPLLQGLGNNDIDPNNIFYKYTNFRDLNDPIQIIFYVFLAFLVKATFTFVVYYFIAKMRASLLGKIKRIVFERYSRIKYSYFESSEIGYLSSVITVQVRGMMQSFFFLSTVIVQILNAGILIFIAYLIAQLQAVFALIGGIFIFLGFNYINKYIRKQSIMYAKTEAKSSSYVNQFLNSFKYLKSTNQNDYFGIPFKKSTEILTIREKNIGIANSLTLAIRDPVAILIILIMVFIQERILSLPVAPVLVSIILFYRALNSIVGCQSNWQYAMEFIGSLEIIDKEIKKLNKNIEKNGQIIIQDIKEGIFFKDIKLSFNKKQKNIIDGITMNIPKNKTIAIVGPSGAGKSTIIDLLTLIRIPTEGNILIDENKSIDIKKESWRDLIGYVQQESTIFDCSIKENITMIPDEPYHTKKISNKIISVAKAANIHDFIESLPEGYFTEAGDKGIKLSGGQRQRICLARELFREPKIMLLDEATSALDIKNEKIVQKSIEKLKGKLTTIIITHRLSSIKFCDYVYVIINGKITEEGTYESLIAKKNSYLNTSNNINI